MTEYMDTGSAELDRLFRKAIIAKVDRVVLAATGHSTPARPRSARDRTQDSHGHRQGQGGPYRKR